MRIVITGGLGVIGSCIALSRAKAGDQVTVIDAGEKKRNVWIRSRLPASIDVRQTRLETSGGHATIADTVRSADLVLHAAASTGIPHSEADPIDDWTSNVEATRALLEYYRHNVGLVPPLVVFSSVKPYGLSRLSPVREGEMFRLRAGYSGVDESFPLEPDEPYAASKMAQSALATAYARSYDLPITTLRFSNLYGPAPCHGPRHGWLTWFCISAAIGHPLSVQGDGRQTRDMLYVTDIERAVLAAAENIQSCQGKIYNVGGGVDRIISVGQAATSLCAATGVSRIPGAARKNDDNLFVTDHAKFTAATGWQPQVDVADGMARVLAWAQQNASDLRLLYL